MFDSNMFTLLAEAEVGKHFYWNLAGFLVHGQVLVVIWFVFLLLLIFAVLGSSNAERIPHGFQNFMESAVEFVTDIAKDQLGERAGAGFLGKWFCGHPNEANSLSRKGAEPIREAPPTRDVDGCRSAR